MLGPEVEPVSAHRRRGPDVQVLYRREALGPVNRQCSNNFRGGPDHEPLLGAVGGRGVDQVPMFGPDPVGVAVRDRREQQELLGRHLEPLFADAALAQQDGLATVQQGVYRRAPLLECECHSASLAAIRATTSGRRNGGTDLGG